MAKLIIFQNDYDTIDAFENVVEYILNKDKDSYIGAQNLLLDHNPLQQFFAVKNYWNDSTKKKVLHFSIFNPLSLKIFICSSIVLNSLSCIILSPKKQNTLKCACVAAEA